MSLNLSKAFSTDKDKENTGIWVDATDDVELLIARLNNTSYQQFMTLEDKKLGRRGKRSDKQSHNLLVRAIARTVLLDWRGVTDDGKSVSYSVDLGEEVLSEQRDLLEFVVEIAADIDNYRSEEEEEDRQNLKK